MNKTRLSQVARWRLLRKRLLDWPSICIAVSGAAIWGLWLSTGLTKVDVTRRLQKPMVSFVSANSGESQFSRSPTIFALPSIYGFGAMDDSSGMPDVDDVWYTSSPHYLARNVVADGSRDAKLISMRVQRSILAPNRRVSTEKGDVFTTNLSTERKLSIVYYGDLRKYEFALPNIDKKTFDQNESWLVRLVVRVDKDGYPDQIFVEKGSSVAGVDSKLVRLINQGKLKQAGESCEGQITINFGL
ncbi:MAG: hypothetical protein KAI74_06205 [Kiritimatiellae bacterium]|nr:hypothetical protein [Kiritimatiellia bacterium]